MGELLEIRGLSTVFPVREGLIRAVDNVNLRMNVDETLGIIGESGSGKSTLALSIMRMVPTPGKIVSGKVLFSGSVDLLSITEDEMRMIRGGQITMSFQDAATYLNPVLSVGEQIAEAIRLHRDIDKRDVASEVYRLMDLVDISSPEKRAREYPHQMSGGMKQRVLIAIALACNPTLYIADEPTTNLDVIVQRDVLDTLNEIKRGTGLSVIMISHDLGVIAQTCNKVAVMYAGELMEQGEVTTLFNEPAHPYTKLLQEAIPRMDMKERRLAVIDGMVPNLADKPPGCPFNPRCPYATQVCKLSRPVWKQIGAEHYVACHHWETVI